MDKNHVIEEVNNSFQDTMMSVLGIEITDFDDNYISGKMPVDNRTKNSLSVFCMVGRALRLLRHSAV